MTVVSDQSTHRRFPLQVALMILIVVATVVAGFLVFPTSQQEREQLLSELGTTNHGRFLLPVKDIHKLALSDNSGQPWQWSQQRTKWRLLIPATADCSQTCRDRLYITRQVHVRLAKNANRLERIFVDLGGEGEEFDTFLEQEHPHVVHLHASVEDYQRWLAGTGVPLDGSDTPAILVDPAGMAMMFYTAEHDGNGMLEDLNHLLKYSND